ncbi:MAG TPA: SIMPL domain-containing protein, partial [Myxococcota bacterium]|nr:SIMPL domain-containing protein [Myxococcota bacterium]
MNSRAAAVLGVSIAIGLLGLGALLGRSAIRFREYERTVTVKGLSEREYPADVVLWPIQFTAADNDQTALYGRVEADSATIKAFLLEHGIDASEISVAPPAVTDRLAQQYGGDARVPFRYAALQTITVYSPHVDRVRAVMKEVV